MKDKKHLLKIVVIGLVAICATILLNPLTAHAQGKDCSDQGLIGNLECEVGKVTNKACEALYGKERCAKDTGDFSFIDFKGGLESFTGEGLDESLTRTRSLRQFIIRVVNFALSFLGLIAVTFVIYGGFLYVTAAGNEEQSGKGKKAIQYAAIGIIIIVASFALVNTLITFVGKEGSDRGSSVAGVGAPGGIGPITGGSGSAGPRGAGVEGTNIGQQGIYNASAGEVSNALKDFLAAYKNRAVIDGVIKGLKNLRRPASTPDNRAYFSEIKGVITELKNKSNPLSKTHVAVKNLLEGWIAQTEAKNLGSDEFKDGKIKDQFEQELDKSSILNASKEDFTNVISELIGNDGMKGRIGKVKSILGEIADARLEYAVNRGFTSEKDIERAFAGLDSNTTVGMIISEVQTNLGKARTELSDNTENTALVLDVVRSLDRFFIIVKNIEFVFVKINASVRQGNAPLIVELNGLDSRDPTGDTISDDRYVWEPQGLSLQEDPESRVLETSPRPNVNCTSKRGATIVCTYFQPGTFIVSLKIRSSNVSRVAKGEAFLPITVSPSVARISLKASAGGTIEELRKYEQDKKGMWGLVIDKSEFQVTTAEAKSAGGIAFDASGSQAGGGGEISSYDWSFGDGSRGEKSPQVKHVYKREGKNQLKLEVTDTGGRKDRKLLTVIVASIAARMEITKTEVDPGELVEFDGSISRSDRGPINAYKWKIVKLGVNNTTEDVTAATQKVSVVGKRDGPVLRLRIAEPGTYKVILEVSDGSQNATREEFISVKSKKPRANLAVRACPSSCVNPSKPGIVEADASSSFDPDKDALIYTWKIFDDKGSEVEKGIAYEVLDKKPLTGKDVKKLIIKFLKTGTFTIQLAVQDDIPQNLQQTDTVTRAVKINSIIEASFDEAMPAVAQLVNGVAKIKVKGVAKNASTVLVDFGDSSEQTIELNPSIGAFEIDHDYSETNTYTITVKASSDSGKGENTIKKRVRVAPAKAPLAAIEVTYDSMPVQEDILEVIRNKPIYFDANKSLNSTGKSGKDAGLEYSWDFGDQKKATGPVVNHAYTELKPDDQPYTVTLTVTEAKDTVQNKASTEFNPLEELTRQSKRDQSIFKVKVVSKKPIVAALALEKKSPGQTTPIDVELTAEGSQDPDGRITNYQFWYYDTVEKDRKLSVIDTQSNTATLTVETKGTENEEREYFFCVSVTDNSNSTATCTELFNENELPKLKVKNGPNKAPKADFRLDRSTARINEQLTFTSSSTDEDGRIKDYIWDFEGDGFQNDNPTQEATVTHRYEKKSPKSGYRVKLKVIDDKGAAGYSKEIPVIIESKSRPPVAKFSYRREQSESGRRIKFIDESRPDIENGAKLSKWKWDFDTSQELNCGGDPATKPAHCNGDKTDDIDSTDQNPVFEFTASGTYQVQLIVEDADGNISQPEKMFVNLLNIPIVPPNIPTVIPQIPGTRTEPQVPVLPAAITVKAVLDSFPKFRFETIDGQQRKVIRFPARPDGTPFSNGEQITFFWGNSRGAGIKYKLDKNIWCDSDGREVVSPVTGRKTTLQDDDIDNRDINGGTCRDPNTGITATHCENMTYAPHSRTRRTAPGHFRAKLTVENATENLVDRDYVDIIFGGTINMSHQCEPASTFTGSLFTKLGRQKTIAAGLIGGIAFIFAVMGIFSLSKRAKRRI